MTEKITSGDILNVQFSTKNYKMHKQQRMDHSQEKKNLTETIAKEAQTSHFLQVNFKPTIINVLSELRKPRTKN